MITMTNITTRSMVLILILVLTSLVVVAAADNSDVRVPPNVEPTGNDPVRVNLMPPNETPSNVNDEDEGQSQEAKKKPKDDNEGAGGQNTIGNCKQVPVNLYQPGNDILPGYALSTPQTVQEFYGYNSNTRSFSEHELVEPFMGGKTTILTIHQDTNTCELSLVVVNSKAGEGDFLASINMYITGDLWNPLVKDDPEFVNFIFADDEYDNIYFRREGMTHIRWFWGTGDTDGMANPLPGPDWEGCIEVDAEFVPQGDDPFRENPLFRPIEEWKYVSGSDDGQGSFAIDLTRDERKGLVYVCVGDFADEKKVQNDDSDPFPEECDEDTIVQGFCGYCERNLCHWHILCNTARFLNCNFGTDINFGW